MKFLKTLQVVMLSSLALLTSACMDEFDPPYLVNKLRVLGVQASPPELRMSQDSDLRVLVAGETEGAKLCYGWAYCPFAWSKDGNFQCLDAELQVDLGTGPTATVGLAQVFQALQNAPKIFDKLGLQTLSGTTTDKQTPDLGCIPGGKVPTSGSPMGSFAGADLPDSYVLFQVAEASAYGGTCPTSSAKMLSTLCANRSNCLTGYKRLSLAPFASACAPFDAVAEPACSKSAAVCPAQTVCGCDGKTYANDCERVAAKVSKAYSGACRSANENPKVPDIAMRIPSVDTAAAVAKGVDWPADVTPVIAPGSAVQLWPRWDTADLQVIGPSADPSVTKPDQESLLFSWFGTEGDYDKQKTYDLYPEVTYTAPALPSGKTELRVDLWLVSRDGRNGTAWTQRSVMIKAGASMAKNPLCTAAPTLAGCGG